ncbi:trimeric intracellular cation channel family protein [Paraflavitalea sp. CAU 1676]|uniref:trimeric intracellular cation channel family protein n=1 Tax=Paraflavitalea sp. CAU 1676 TaxID=3032598 RepID=UPI0023DA0D37|nr:trimeric intracellular cation channel family protein [Paraflavitalea sp. CAU 1676]MDF2189708.1 trimeric intracellular cation channel family protein [Paraflavitalea sp. CAU 1676]
MEYNFLNIIDILGTIAFAASGAFSAMERKLDPFGVVILSFVTAIGGGTLRDMLIGNTPVAWLRNEVTALVILATAFITLFFGQYVKQFHKTLFLFDAMGLGVFTLIGVEKGLQMHLSPGICIALGTITACFGGVIRDVLLNNVPLIFQREIYASACIIGGSLYLLLQQTPLNDDINAILAIIMIVVIRIVAIRYKLMLPRVYENRM